MDWGSLETTLHPVPTFFVQAPDGRKDWTELQRQGTFLALMKRAAPRLLVYPNANAGKRNPSKARAEGIRSGVFDLTIVWQRSKIAYLEFKGYTSGGRPGALSDNQIEFGNRLVELDVPCACFFDPYAAANWLRELGFPVAEVRHAA